MKKFTVMAVLVFVFLSTAFCFTAPAEALLKSWSYETFSIQTPKDWEGKKTGTTVSISNADKSLLLEITVVGRQGEETSREFAEGFRSGFSNPSDLKDNGDGLFTFTFDDPDGNKRRYIAGAAAHSRIVICVTGKDADLEAVLNSLQLKVSFFPNVKALL